MTRTRSLVRAALGLFAVLLLTACGPRATSAKDEAAIRNNLEQLHLAATQFMLEEALPQARYADLVGEGRPIRTMKPVNGEDYSGIVVKSDTKSLSVRTADGKTVEWTARK